MSGGTENDDGVGEQARPNYDAVADDAVADVAAEVAESVARPSYEVLPPASQPSPISTSKMPVNQSGDAIEGNFAVNQTVPERIQGTMEEWGRMRQWLHRQDVAKLERKQVMAVTKAFLDFQFQDMQHQMMLAMDTTKKTRFAQYLAAIGPLQNLIQNQSAEAQLAIANTMFDNRFEAYRTKNERDIKLKKMRSEDRVDQRQYEKTLKDNEAYSDSLVDRLDDTAKIMITRHMEFLYKTLELFETKLIEKGKL